MSINLKKVNQVVFITLLLICPAVLFAQSEAACIFLLIEPGSRPGGMGHAYVAQVDDALAGYWNPGAMAWNRKNQFSLMHTNWMGDVDGIDDMYIEYFGWNNYFESLSGNLGFHLVYLTYGKQDRTDEIGTNLGTFTSYELALASSYAYQYSENLGLGITFKFILSDLAPAGANQSESDTKGRGMSFAFDLGLKKKNLLFNGLDFGFNLQNIGPDITFVNEDQADPLPMNLRLGFSARLKEADDGMITKWVINADMNKLLANDDFVLKRIISAWKDDGGWFSKTEVEKMIFGVGTEMTYMKLLTGRVGYIYDKAGEIMGPNFGVGIEYTFANKYKATFDFAMQQGGEMLDGGFNKTFSVGLEF